MAKSKKLLIRLSSAGDVLLSSPLIRILKSREQESEIHFVVKEQYASLIQHNPNVTKVHLVQDNATFHELRVLRQSLAEEGFNEVLDLHNNLRSNYLRKGIAEKVSVINKEVLKRTILVKTKLNLFSSVRSVALKYAQVYDKDINVVPPPEIFVTEQTRRKVDVLWQNMTSHGSKSIFICPGARHFTKRWPTEYWTELVRKIQTHYRVVLVGGKEDSWICDQIEKNTNAVNLCGKLSLIESAAMLFHADLTITNDSFLMHAANAAGKNIIAIFGSSVKEFGFSPYGVPYKIMQVDGLSCRPCSHVGREYCPKKHFRCMRDTKPEKVYRATMDMLEK